MTTDVTAALAELGLEPGDLPREVLDVVADHLDEHKLDEHELDEHEHDMGEPIRSEKAAIPDERTATP